MKTVKVDEHLIGEDYPCFIVLELGVNFQSMTEAKRLLDTAIEIGADAVKFQTFHAKTIAMRGTILYDGRGQIDQYEESLESEDRLTEEFQTELIRYAQSKGITTFSTPSHFTDIDLLNRIGGIPAFKIGSDDLTNLPFLKYAAKFGKPIFLSSGVSTIGDIDEAIKTIQAEGNDQILLFHCVSQYPAKAEDMNLRTIQTLRQAFDVPVGLSDHTEGIGVSIGAVAMGAKIIEKHFTLDRSAPGPDNFFSMEPGPMKQIIDGIREVEAAMGVPFKDIRKVEKPMVVNFHKSIFAIEDIGQGEPISEKNVEILRPLQGIPAKYYDIVCGMKPTKPIPKGRALQWSDFKE
jgi:N,N'-diacetyllegionaminate synthase